MPRRNIKFDVSLIGRRHIAGATDAFHTKKVKLTCEREGEIVSISLPAWITAFVGADVQAPSRPWLLAGHPTFPGPLPA